MIWKKDLLERIETLEQQMMSEWERAKALYEKTAEAIDQAERAMTMAREALTALAEDKEARDEAQKKYTAVCDGINNILGYWPGTEKKDER